MLFARRWLLKHHGLVYDDVAIAADIWNQVYDYLRVADGARLAVQNEVNGARSLPSVGDLLIYSEKYQATGHVAVVGNVKRQDGFVEVLESNFEHPTANQAAMRKIPYIQNAGRYWLLDGYLIGWKCLPD